MRTDFCGIALDGVMFVITNICLAMFFFFGHIALFAFTAAEYIDGENGGW